MAPAFMAKLQSMLPPIVAPSHTPSFLSLSSFAPQNHNTIGRSITSNSSLDKDCANRKPNPW